MKLFSELTSCYRSQNPPAASTAAPPSDDDTRATINASHSNRLHRSHWRPSLAVIMEDSVDQDRHSNVDRKSQKKSVAKPRSSLNTTCSFHTDQRPRNCMPPVILIAPFSATPYMF